MNKILATKVYYIALSICCYIDILIKDAFLEKIQLSNRNWLKNSLRSQQNNGLSVNI